MEAIFMKYHKILENMEYRYCLDKLDELEQDRIYCRHGLEHFYAVARITLMLAQEGGISVDEDVVYGAALLHDLGRYDINAENHEAVSCELARKILPDCEYNFDTIQQIVNIISNHRGRYSISKIQELRRSKKLDLNECFRVADQISRRCFECKSSETCKWKDEEKIHFEFIELQGET